MNAPALYSFVMAALSLANVPQSLDMSGLKGAAQSKILPSTQCERSLFELFSCKMDSDRFVAICLSKDVSRINIVYSNNRKEKQSFAIDNPEQLIGANSHGDSVVISGNTPNDHLTLFIDTNHYDPAMAALTHSNKGIKTEFCKNSVFKTESHYTNATHSYINIFSLTNLHVTKMLSSPLSWPSK